MGAHEDGLHHPSRTRERGSIIWAGHGAYGLATNRPDFVQNGDGAGVLRPEKESTRTIGGASDRRLGSTVIRRKIKVPVAVQTCDQDVCSVTHSCEVAGISKTHGLKVHASTAGEASVACHKVTGCDSRVACCALIPLL